jgi:hypothetical protein
MKYRSALAIISCLLIIQYLYNRSLWVDEAMLSLNIINRDFSGLMRPLDNHQVAPALFLLIEKSMTLLFGDSEPGLRIFPLLCALLALPLFYSICLKLTGNRTISLCALVLLGCSTSFVYYSSEVKQYACDLMVLLAIYYIALFDSVFLNRWRTQILAIAGGIAIFLSSVSVIALCTVGMWRLYGAWRIKKLHFRHWVPPAAWIFCFILNYFLFIRNHPHTQFMKAFWENAFMPLNIFSTPFHKWMDKSVVQVFRDLLPSLPWGYWFFATLILYASGLVLMIRRKDLKLLYLCVAPVIIHLTLSALKAYPFELRLILYQSPLYILVMAYATWHLSNGFLQRPSMRSWIVVAITALLSFKLILQYPVLHDEIKPAIQYINQYSLPGETLYAFRGSVPVTQYYMETGLANFDLLTRIWGSARTSSIASYLNELAPVKGRTWLLVSHIYPFNGNREEEFKVIIALKKRGTLLRQSAWHGSSAYQFDLR